MDLQETYELLVSLLSRCPQTIEILPGDGAATWIPTQNPAEIEPELSFSPFLFVDGNLGVPQKTLFNVYLRAVGIFKSARSHVPPDYELDASLNHHLIASSSILLLANPSHQTALNARKHLVRMGLIDTHAELRFTASLLSSQHCAKHAELWYHRRWLLGSTDDTQFSDAEGMDSGARLQFPSREAIQQELELVSRACDLYPRNYFAWMHRLICIRSLLSDYLVGMDIVEFVSFFRTEITSIKGWIDYHVSDYSAIHTILALSQAAFQSGDLSLKDIIIRENLMDHAVSLVKEYPTHQALWMYIQTCLSLLDSWQAQPIQQFRENFVQPLVLAQISEISTNEDIAKGSQYARLFLDRSAGHRLSGKHAHFDMFHGGK